MKAKADTYYLLYIGDKFIADSLHLKRRLTSVIITNKSVKIAKSNR